MAENNIVGVPWMLAGARHSADLGRGIAYAASEGGQGVVLPGDFKVTARVPATTAVDLAPGGLYIPQRAANVHAQTYLAIANLPSIVDGPPSDPAARSYLVIVDIRDPQFGYSGYPESDVDKVKNGPYVFPELYGPVAAGVTRVEEVPALVGKAVYAVARLDIPENTTTITEGMVVDLRKLATPKNDRFFDSNQYVGAAINLSPAESDPEWIQWPPFQPFVDVPSWATDFRQVITIANVRQFADRTVGQFRAMLGTIGGASPAFDFEPGNAPGAPGATRTLIASNGGDCRDIAGTTVKSWGEGVVSMGGLAIASGVHVIHDIQFYQRIA